MKTKSLLAISFLLLVSAITLQAQNVLPDPHNDACWQSLDSLRACQLEQYNREMDYAQRCTSYPEYQCNPSTPDTTATEKLGKATSKSKDASTNASQMQSPTSSTQSPAVSSKLLTANGQ